MHQRHSPVPAEEIYPGEQIDLESFLKRVPTRETLASRYFCLHIQASFSWVGRLKTARIPCTLCETLQTFVGIDQIM